MAKSKKPKKVRPKKVKPKKAGLSPALQQYASSLDLNGIRSQPRLLSLLFCDFQSFTKDDKVNLLGIFDRAFVDPERKVTPRFVLYVRTAEATEEAITVTVFTPSGKPGLAFQFGGVAQAYTPDVPAQVQLVIGLQFTAETEGVYWFDVSYKQKSLGGAGLVVKFRPTEDKEGGTDTYI